jgi:hypothetical protein
VQTQDHSDDRRGHHASVRVGFHSLPFVHSDDVVVNNVSDSVVQDRCWCEYCSLPPRIFLALRRIEHTHTHTLSLTHTHKHTHSLAHTRTHTHTLAHTRAHTHTHTHAHSLTHSLTHAHTHSHTHSLTLAHTHTHTHTHSLTHSLTHAHTHTHMLPTRTTTVWFVEWCHAHHSTCKSLFTFHEKLTLPFSFANAHDDPGT